MTRTEAIAALLGAGTATEPARTQERLAALSALGVTRAEFADAKRHVSQQEITALREKASAREAELPTITDWAPDLAPGVPGVTGILPPR